MFEKYSKENFEDAQKKAQEAAHYLKYEKGENPPPGGYEKGEIPRINPALPLAMLQDMLARRSLERLAGLAQKEAQERNEEYERLKQKVQDDLGVLENFEALKDFESKKLGMHQKKEEFEQLQKKELVELREEIAESAKMKEDVKEYLKKHSTSFREENDINKT